MARPEVAEFAAVRLGGPRRSRGPLVLAAWVLGLGSIAGVGLAGRTDQPPVGKVIEAPPAEPQQAVGPEDPWPPLILEVRDPATVVTLTRPSAADMEVTTPRLVVSGIVTGPVRWLEIALEARGNRVLERTTRSYGPLYGRPPSIGGAFSASFDLPAPRPNGSMWISVTAYVDSMPVGGMRVRFRIGPLLADPVNRFVIDDLVAGVRSVAADGPAARPAARAAAGPGVIARRLRGLGWTTDPVQS